MAIHDPECEATCDGDDCMSSVFLPMNWTTGGYNLSDSLAEKVLEREHGWQVIDGKHFCKNCHE